MPYGFFTVDTPLNEVTHDYRPGSPERKKVEEAYKKMFQSKIEVPLYLGYEEVFTKETRPIRPPHDHQHTSSAPIVLRSQHTSSVQLRTPSKPKRSGQRCHGNIAFRFLSKQLT